jgi:hypothetical protein
MPEDNSEADPDEDKLDNGDSQSDEQAIEVCTFFPFFSTN